MKIIKTAKVVESQDSPFGVQYIGSSDNYDFDVDDVKIGNDSWSFEVNSEAVKFESPLSDMIVSGVKRTNINEEALGQVFENGALVVAELQKNPAYEEDFLWNVFRNEYAQLEDENRVDNIEQQRDVEEGNFEEPDYGQDPLRPEF